MDLMLANHTELSNIYIDDFIDNLKNSSLEFDSEDLRSFGITSNNQIEKAIDRARLTCSLSGLDLSWHFHAYYIGMNGEVQHAWKLSKLAFLLALYKADALKSDTANFQTEMAENMLENFELHEMA